MSACVSECEMVKMEVCNIEVEVQYIVCKVYMVSFQRSVCIFKWLGVVCVGILTLLKETV